MPPTALLLFLALIPLQAFETPPTYSDKDNLLHYIGPDAKSHPITSPSTWQKRRRHILANMQLVMGPFPKINHRLPLRIEVLKEVSLEKYTWRRITYASESNDRAYAYLYIPHNLTSKAPAIVSLHGTTYPRYVPPTAPQPPADSQYAHELAEKGYIVIAPDYVFLSPDYKTDPYALGYQSGTMKAIVNHIRAVDVLTSMPQVDRKRIAAIGLSLGGHNALFLAVFDTRVRAAVTSAGFNTFRKYYSGNLKGWTSNRYMPRIASEYRSRPDLVPFDFTEVLAAIAPRPVFINAPTKDDNFEVTGVQDCVKAAGPVYKLLKAEGRLVAQYPEGGHGFSTSARQTAYEFLDRWLNKRP